MAALFGLLLIVFGTLIIWLPNLLPFLVGGAFIFFGIGAIAVGRKVKSAVTYRRIDADVHQQE